ncbi:MAG: YidC/Oxa1 family membrane protein insertase [Acidimicrobiales bacterium]|nr:YidC/Oxa1 family membrane protein insertase [Acidimicrobiales bacterium]
MNTFFEFLATVLSQIYSIWPSYGGSIIIFTLIFMVIMTPVTIRQTKSMLAMQRLAPETKKLKQKYGSDRDRMNKEMMALYQANNVNPLGGCLPLVIQSPVFLGLFYLVRGLTRRIGDLGIAIGDAATRGTAEITVFTERTFNPEWLDKGTDLYQDLAISTEMNSFGFDLAQTPKTMLTNDFFSGLPYLLLVLLVGVSSWLQQKQIQGRSSNAMSPQQAAIMKFLPFMLPIFSFAFPTALIFYFLTSNIFRVGQQLFITRRFYGDDKEDSKIIVPTAKDTASREKEEAVDSAAKKNTSNHGSRRPVANPPKKRKKKPPPAETPKKGKVAERKEPTNRPHSKRVTPKKNIQEDGPGSNRRKKKRKEE